MRICPHCQLEQSDGTRFCTDCGQPLDVMEADEMPRREAAIEPSDGGASHITNDPAAAWTEAYYDDAARDETTSSSAEAVESAEESAFKQEADSSVISGTSSAGSAWAGFGVHLLLPLVSAGAVVAISIALGAWFASSRFMSSWIYRLYYNIWGWYETEALAVADTYRWSWWHVLAQAHAGQVETSWRNAASGVEGGLVYELRLPLIGILLIAFLMIWVIHSIFAVRLKRRAGAKTGIGMRVAAVAGQAVVYGLVIALLLTIFSPRFSWDRSSALEDLTMRDSVSFLSVWWQAAALYAVAAWAGQAWRVRRSSGPSGSRPVNLGSGLRLLARWAMLVCAVMLVIGLLIPAVWSMSDPMSFYEQPPTSLVQQWQMYGTDPALLTGMPAFLVQEWLYATGGTVHLDGFMLADALRLQPMSLHLVTGLSLDSETVGEPTSSVMALASAARSNWHIWSMLLLIIYGTFRLASRSSWLDIAVLVVGAGLFAAAAAEISAISLEMELTATQRLGHQPMFAALQTAVVSLIAAAAGKLWASRFGLNRTARGVTASGN